jgi:hypothetical protein
MDAIHVQYFYGLGFALGRVQFVSVCDEKLNNWRWSNTIEAAKGWMRSVSEIDGGLLPKTKKAAPILLEVLDNFSNLLGQDREPTSDESGLISQGITAFYNVFEQEIEDTHCFIVTPVGAYAASALLKNASSHLSQAAQKVVSDDIREDFNKSGECLALDLYTACGFHALRAVEAAALFYHRNVTGVELSDVPLGTLIYGNQKDYPGSGLRPQYVKEGSPNDSPLGLIISLLSQINAIYRIPLMHPKMSLKSYTAKFVFDTSAIAISAMVTDTIERFKRKQAEREQAQPKTEE